MSALAIANPGAPEPKELLFPQKVDAPFGNAGVSDGRNPMPALQKADDRRPDRLRQDRFQVFAVRQS